MGGCFGKSGGQADDQASASSSCIVLESKMKTVSHISFDQVTSHRNQLPAKRSKIAGPSIWDISKTSLPASNNEPLSALQKLCEDLEYSELLDKASELSDPYERMAYVAAFAVSSYSSSHYRAKSKPFNPLLGETYECIREDKGFRFVSEQVSHHPPISVCYAESLNFIYWKDARVKTKFWGRSLELQFTGNVHLKLLRPGGVDWYRYIKLPTTCVHNLFGGTPWIEHYGELVISTGKIICKLIFSKASSDKHHEVHGVIFNEDHNEVVCELFGKWSEALYYSERAICIWRAAIMPKDFALYYGFTKFAMELNELNPETAKYLPITDSRFRPDQRMLEEGNLVGADTMKIVLEQQQRERHRLNEELGLFHEPKWFSKTILGNGEETWEFSHKYWEVRKSPGFASINFKPQMW